MPRFTVYMSQECFRSGSVEVEASDAADARAKADAAIDVGGVKWDDPKPDGEVTMHEVQDAECKVVWSE